MAAGLCAALVAHLAAYPAAYPAALGTAHVAGLSGLASLASLADDPQVFAVRVGLSALALLLALTFAPRLADVLTTAPHQSEGTPSTGRGVGTPRQAVNTAVETQAGVGAGAGHWLRVIARASIWIAAVIAVAVVWLWGRSGFLPDSPRVLLTQAGYVLTRVAISLLVLAVTLALGHALDSGLEMALERAHVNRNLLVLAGHAIYIATIIIGVIVILSVWGVSLVVPVTLIGVISVALSVALQDVLKNVVCGVYLLIERPFVIGDEIAVTPLSGATFAGIIEDIEIRVTHLRTPDGQLALVPNATLFTMPVVNKSAYRRRRVGLSLKVPLTAAAGENGANNGANGAHLDHAAHGANGSHGEHGAHGAEGAEQRVLAAMRATKGVRAEPPPEVTLIGFGVGSCELRVRFWVPTGDPRRESEIISAAVEQLRLELPGAEIKPLGGPVGGAPVAV